MLVALAAVVSMATGAPVSSIPDPSASAIVPSASDRVLYEEGRSKERIALGLVRPRIFAIALLRDRALRDMTVTQKMLDQFRHNPGVAPGLAALSTLRPFIEAGDFSHVDNQIWNAGTVEWHNFDPQTLWMINAGAASVDVDAARTDPYVDLDVLDHPFALMAFDVFAGKYADVVPQKDKAAIMPLLPESPSLADRQSYEADLSEQLARAFPEPAYPAITYGTGLVADARRGVAISTATEMLFEPVLIGQHDSQAFFDELIASLKSTTSDRNLLGVFDELRSELSVPARPISDYSGRPGMISGATTLYSFRIDHTRSDSFRLGQAAADTFFDASIGFDSKRIAGQEAWIGAIADLDSAIPGLRAARLDLSSTSPADPLAIRAKSLRVINLIMGSS
jgi:hypothetical protein